MCNYRANYEDFARARRLRDRGIPLDEYELKRMEAVCLGLMILEDTSLPSTVFDLSSGGAGYILSVVISNESRRPLAPVHIGFESPDWEAGMRLLPDPYKEYPARRGNAHRRVRDNSGCLVDYSNARNFYVFRIRPLMIYPRDEVLNHRIARSCFLYPGDSLEGWLLAVGEKPIPPEYGNRDRLEMRLTLFDQRGHFYRATFRPMVQRSHQEPTTPGGVRFAGSNMDSGPAGSGCRLRDDPQAALGQEKGGGRVTLWTAPIG